MSSRHPLHAVLLEFGMPLTPRQQAMLASDTLAAGWHPGPGRQPITGVLVVPGRDAEAAANVARGACLVALGARIPVSIAAVVRTDLDWPPDWWPAQPARPSS